LPFSKSVKRLDSLHAAQLAADRRRDRVARRAAPKPERLEAERGTLAAQMRAAYMIGRQEQMKLLLNQGNPASVGRMLIITAISRASAAPR
jgi:septal ring factor EnvC (AmiA/AmiB activator)